MIRRVVDLSIECAPATSGPLLSYPLPAHIEPTGPGHPRQFVQRVCHTIPYVFSNNEIGVDVYLGDSLPHTHAESLLVNKVTILSEIPAHRRWVVRDIASVPAAEWVREAAVIDISHLDPSVPPPLQAVKEAARHLQWGDFVIWRTGHRQEAAGPEMQPYSPGIPFDVARWLVEDRGIVGIMSDAPVDPVRDRTVVGAGAAKVHTYFYENAVLMIDEGVHFDRLDAERVFFCGGLSLKTSGIGSSPARAIALKGGSPDLVGREIVDLFQPMAPSTGLDVFAPIQRIEPLELRSDIFKRYEVYGLQIAGDPGREASQANGADIRPTRDYGSPIRLFNSHLGTHIRLPHTTVGSAAGRDLMVSHIADVPSSQLIGPALLIDLTSVGPQQVVSRRLLEKEAADLRPGEIALLWTGFSDRYYHREDFLRWTPRFELDALRWLLERGARLLATDAASLEPHSCDDHLPSAADPLLAEYSVPAVVCATNMWLVRKKRCFVICAPIPLTGLPTAPTRVIAVEEWVNSSR